MTVFEILVLVGVLAVGGTIAAALWQAAKH
jgi:hypothetical protein